MFERFFSDREAGHWRFAAETRILFGAAIPDQLPRLCSQLGCRIGVLSDSGVLQLERTQNYLASLQNSVDAQATIGFETDLADLRRAVMQFRQAGVDQLLAIGGGSVLDGAKLVAASLRYGVDPTELVALTQPQGAALPLICMPTTFGTGAEVNMYAHINDRDRGVKQALKKAFLTPDYALVDPAFSRDLPEETKYLAGVDAFVHLIEALTLKRETSPLQKALLREGLRLFLEHFVRYLEGPDDEAEAAIATAALIGGLGIHNARTGLIHSLATTLARRLKLSHARSILPFVLPVLLFNGVKVWQELGCAGADELRKLCNTRVLLGGSQLSLSTILSVAEVDEMVEECLRDQVLFKENPRSLARQDLLALYHGVIHGENDG